MSAILYSTLPRLSVGVHAKKFVFLKIVDVDTVPTVLTVESEGWICFRGERLLLGPSLSCFVMQVFLIVHQQHPITNRKITTKDNGNGKRMSSFAGGTGVGGASSPYAPTRRNSYLRRSSSSSIGSAAIVAADGRRSSSGMIGYAFVLFVVRYWNRIYEHRHTITQHVYDWLSRLRTLQIPTLKTDGSNIIALRTSITTAATANTAPDTPELGNALHRIQENQRLINSVLEYWFGQYPPERSQKMLWMIGNSSIDHRRRVDEEITVKFLPVLLELASTTGQEHAAASSSAPTPSTTAVISDRWEEWCFDPDAIYGVYGKVAAIIVLDQFSRHIQRHYEEEQEQSQQEQPPPSLPSKNKLDQLALKTAKLLFEPTKAECSPNVDSDQEETTVLWRNRHQMVQSMIPLPMMIFALMPYRHASTIESVSYVQQCIEQCSTHQQQLNDMLSRFRKATNRRMALLQDEARRTGNSESTKPDKQQHRATDILPEDNNSRHFTDEDILETFAFEADMVPSLKHPIHKTIADFLTARGIRPASSSTKASKPSASIIVSLSGGVDSMVIASVLSYLQKSCGYSHLSIWAVHIDYGNRPESRAEADFVRRYCEDTLQNVHFVCQRIDEVTRGITARDDYERIAREIRYKTYRKTIAAAKGDISPSGQEEPIIGVMLGHHRGDLRENVLSNAHKGCGPLDLSGMTSVSTNDGVLIYRPLLPLEKSFVLDYAHQFGVPYFKDTTPSWSTRGKLRTKLLPLLEEIYGDGSMNNLSNLAVESDECRALLQKSMIAPFMDAIVKKPMGIIMQTAPWKNQPTFFWKFVLREALHNAAGLGMFSDKSVVSFLERVQAEKVKEGWLQCRKDYGVYLQKDGTVFVFYPSSFPWSQKTSYNIMGEIVDVGTSRDVGPWTVKTELVASGTPYIETLLSKKAVATMGALMEGRIDYYLECPCISGGANSDQFRLTRPLVFREFRRVDRPIAWKSADLRIQSTLPILGNQSSDDDGTDCDLSGACGKEGMAVVRVSILLRNPGDKM